MGTTLHQLDPPTTGQRPVSRRYAWTVFALLIALMVMDYVDRQVVVSMFPHLKAQWDLSDAMLGGLVSIVSITVALGTLPLSFIADRWSRVKSIFLMALVWSIATIACAFAQSYGQLLAMRSIVGLGEAAYGAAGAALLATLFPARMRSTVLGAFLAAALVGSVMGVVAGGVIAERWGWQAGFGVVGVPGLDDAVVLGTYRPEGLLARSPLSALLATVERRRDGLNLRLGTLDLDDVADVAAQFLGAGVAYRDVKALHHRSGGNPFFLGELLTVAGEHGASDVARLRAPEESDLLGAVLLELVGPADHAVAEIKVEVRQVVAGIESPAMPHDRQAVDRGAGVLEGGGRLFQEVDGEGEPRLRHAIERGLVLGRNHQVQCGQVVLQLFQRPRPQDGRGHARSGLDPGDRHSRRRAANRVRHANQLVDHVEGVSIQALRHQLAAASLLLSRLLARVLPSEDARAERRPGRHP